MKNRKENKILTIDDIKSVSLSGCDKLTEMNGTDLQSLLTELDKLYLTLRPKINIDKKITFGMEIEYEDALFLSINRKIRKGLHNEKILSHWDSGTDGTVNGELRSPVCTDTEQTWKDLETVCKILKRSKASALNRAGGHVHIGSSILTDDANLWLRFLKVWTIYEKVIYRFSYGDKLFFRGNGKEYAHPISNDLYGTIMYDNDPDNIFRHVVRCSRRDGVNFQNVDLYDIYDTTSKNTIEFRCPNGSVEEVIWQNNVNLFTKLLLFCRNNDNYDDLINSKFKKYRDSESFNKTDLYGEIFLSDALEFSDMIFDNNVDKIYFLKQYLKDYDNLEGTYAKKFVR